MLLGKFGIQRVITKFTFSFVKSQNNATSATSKHPIQTTVCWISEACPTFVKLFGGIMKAEKNVRQNLADFYISKIVWVPKENGWYGNSHAVRRWNKTARNKAFVVEGEPFVEDLTKPATSPILEMKVAPGSITQEQIFSQMRRFGKLRDISLDESKGVARVVFKDKRDATCARNCLDGKVINESKVRINYIPISWKLPVDIITSPRAIVPLAAFTFVTFTALLSPIRFYTVVQRMTVEKSIEWAYHGPTTYVLNSETENECFFRDLFSSVPSNILLVIGSKGMEKSSLLKKVIQNRMFATRVDCSKVESVQDFIDFFVRDIGFRPSFTFLNHIFFVLFSSFIPNAMQVSHDSQIKSVLNTLDRIFLLPRTAMQNAVLIFDEFDQFLRILDSGNAEEVKRAKLVLKILSDWARNTTVNGKAHIVFVANSGFTIDMISQFDGFKSIPTIWFDDIEKGMAREYLKSEIIKLKGPDTPTLEQVPALVELFGGRLGDLDHLLLLISRNKSVGDAANEMLEDAKILVRKSGLGSMIFGGTKLPWNQAQLWKMMKLLKEEEYVKYDTVLVKIFEGNEEAIKGLVEKQILAVSMIDGGRKVIKAYSPLILAAFKVIMSDDMDLCLGMEKYCKQLEIDKELGIIEKLETELQKLSKILIQDQINLKNGGIQNRCKQIDSEIQVSYKKLVQKKEEFNDIVEKILALNPYVHECDEQK